MRWANVQLEFIWPEVLSGYLSTLKLPNVYNRDFGKPDSLWGLPGILMAVMEERREKAVACHQIQGSGGRSHRPATIEARALHISIIKTHGIPTISQQEGCKHLPMLSKARCSWQPTASLWHQTLGLVPTHFLKGQNNSTDKAPSTLPMQTLIRAQSSDLKYGAIALATP